MFGRPDRDASRHRAASVRREMVKDYWYEQQLQRNQPVQYCMCGAKKLRATTGRGSTPEYHCPNRHRPDHRPGAVYGRSLLVYRPNA